MKSNIFIFLTPDSAQDHLGHSIKACACSNAAPPGAVVTGALSAASETRERGFPGLLVSDPIFSNGSLSFWKKSPRRVLTSPTRTRDHLSLRAVKRNITLIADVRNIASQSDQAGNIYFLTAPKQRKHDIRSHLLALWSVPRPAATKHGMQIEPRA